jgi:hypothetical protein
LDLPRLRVSIGAVSMARMGIATENLALIREGQKLYGATLQAMIKRMTDLTEKKSVAVGTTQELPMSMEMMAISVICVWYEATSSTNPNAWIEHSFDAGRLVLTKPPEDFTSGLGHAIFRTVRYMIVCPAHS